MTKNSVKTLIYVSNDKITMDVNCLNFSNHVNCENCTCSLKCKNPVTFPHRICDERVDIYRVFCDFFESFKERNFKNGNNRELLLFNSEHVGIRLENENIIDQDYDFLISTINEGGYKPNASVILQNVENGQIAHVYEGIFGKIFELVDAKMFRGIRMEDGKVLEYHDFEKVFSFDNPIKTTDGNMELCEDIFANLIDELIRDNEEIESFKNNDDKYDFIVKILMKYPLLSLGNIRNVAIDLYNCPEYRDIIYISTYTNLYGYYGDTEQFIYYTKGCNLPEIFEAILMYVTGLKDYLTRENDNILVIPENLYWEANPIGLLSLVRFFKHLEKYTVRTNNDNISTIKIDGIFHHRGQEIHIKMIDAFKIDYMDDENEMYENEESIVIEINIPCALESTRRFMLIEILQDVMDIESFELLYHENSTHLKIVPERDQYLKLDRVVTSEEILHMIIKTIVMTDFEFLNFHTLDFPK